MFALNCRWFRHITEASNAYKTRESGRRAGARAGAAGGPATAAAAGASPSSAGSSADHNGLEPGKAEDGSGKPAGRSHSFHEQGSAAAAAAASPTSAGKDGAAAADKESPDDTAQKTGMVESETALSGSLYLSL